MKFFILFGSSSFLRAFVAVFAWLSLLQAGASAQSFNLQGEWSGAKSDGQYRHFYSVKIRGTYAYVFAGHPAIAGIGQLRIIDVSDIKNPRQVSALEVAAKNRFVLDGNYIYAISSHGGLEIINIADPEHPTRQSYYNPDYGVANSLTLAGSNLYYVGPKGVHVFDVSNPASPQVLGGYSTASSAGEIRIKDGFGFVTTSAGAFENSSQLVVLDLSSPAAPSFLTSIVLPGNVVANQLRIRGDMAVVLGLWGPGGAQLRSFDISNPGAPRALDRSPFLANASGGDFYGENFYVATGAGVRIFKIGNDGVFTDMGVIANFQADTDIDFSDNMAFVTATDARGLGIFNLSNPNAPSFDGSFIPYIDFLTMALGSEHAYVLDNAGRVHVLSILNPSAPQEVAIKQRATAGLRAEVDGNRLYVLNPAGFDVFDISNPTNLVQVGTWTSAFPQYSRMAVSNGLVYLLSPNDYVSLFVVDASNLANIHLVGQYGDFRRTKDVKVVGGYAFVSQFLAATSLPTIGDQTVVSVLNVTNPANPVFVKNVTLLKTGVSDSTPRPVDMALAGNKLLVTGQMGLSIVDVSDPAQAEVLATQPGPQGEVVGGSPGFAFVGRTTTLEALDTREITHITSIKTNAVPSALVTVVGKDDLAYALISLTGLKIYKAIPTALPPSGLQLQFARAGGKFILYWDDSFTGFSLYGRPTLDAGWNLITSSPAHSGSSFVFTNNNPILPSQFYRLAK